MPPEFAQESVWPQRMQCECHKNKQGFSRYGRFCSDFHGPEKLFRHFLKIVHDSIEVIVKSLHRAWSKIPENKPRDPEPSQMKCISIQPSACTIPAPHQGNPQSHT